MGVSAGAKTKKTVPNAPVSGKEDEETGPKGRELIAVDDEDEPYKVIKIEPPELERLQSTASERLKNKSAETSEPKPVEKAGVEATTTDNEKAAMPVAKETPKSKEKEKKEKKEKKTAKIEMKLKANRLKQEEIELIQ